VTGREHAIAYRRAHYAQVCNRHVAWAHGVAEFADDFPLSWNLNEVRVEGPDTGLSAQDLAAAADGLQAGLAHRQITVEDEEAGRRLRPGFDALGWDTERLVWMELTGPAHGDPVPAEITEVPLPRSRPLRESWFRTSAWMPTPEAVREFMDVEERIAALTGSRTLMAWGPGGAPLGYATFVAGAGAAEVEQAYVEPHARGQGIGGALVSAAVAAAGQARTYIVADDEEDAKRLYERLGFVPVWYQHQFIRRPPVPTGERAGQTKLP
jgi:ribosomal protein S18 acetylase RimI-like enzyme